MQKAKKIRTVFGLMNALFFVALLILAIILTIKDGWISLPIAVAAVFPLISGIKVMRGKSWSWAFTGFIWTLMGVFYFLLLAYVLGILRCSLTSLLSWV